MKPVITEDYRAQQSQLHATGMYGTTGAKYGPLVLALIEALDASCLLDYGCGSRRSLLETLQMPEDVVYEGYDPAVPAYAAPPAPADLVCCIDVLEHIEPALLDNVLDQMSELVDPYGFFTVHTGPAQKVLSDGRNAHLIQQGEPWWRARFSGRFEVVHAAPIANGFCVLVCNNDISRVDRSRLETAAQVLRRTFGSGNAEASSTGAGKAATSSVLHAGSLLHFHTPNAATQWRVKSLDTKEPDTIRWLDAMPTGSTLLDIGANVGMYSILAAKTRGCRVFAFEPESQNYALLNANIALNKTSDLITAFPIALSDETKVDRLFLSEFTAGSSCHSFGADVDHHLHARRSPFAQGCVSMPVDQLVFSGAMPVPHFIKIDVDGFEHKVLQGAQRTLSDPHVKSVLVELNTRLEEHLACIKMLEALGFHHDPVQAQRALRTSGEFQGVGEFIFTRQAPARKVELLQRTNLSLPASARGRSVLHHVLRRVAESAVTSNPFPYAVIDDIFPPDYYAEMLRHFPAISSMRPLSETGRVGKNDYKERMTTLFTEEDFARLTAEQADFWREFAGWMYSDTFLHAFIDKFQPALEPRIAKVQAAEGQLKVRGDALLVDDQTNYAIGPHTDAPHRLVTFLFYLPKDASMRELGTSLYTPKEPGFTCWGGPHHPHDRFNHVGMVEFLPNRLLAFPKTEHSFHGVEPIRRENVSRHVLINNIRLLNQVTH